MPRVGFEPTISAGERPKTYTLDRAATGTGYLYTRCLKNQKSAVLSIWEFAISFLAGRTATRTYVVLSSTSKQAMELNIVKPTSYFMYQQV